MIVLIVRHVLRNKRPGTICHIWYRGEQIFKNYREFLKFHFLWLHFGNKELLNSGELNFNSEELKFRWGEFQNRLKFMVCWVPPVTLAYHLVCVDILHMLRDVFLFPPIFQDVWNTSGKKRSTWRMCQVPLYRQILSGFLQVLSP